MITLQNREPSVAAFRELMRDTNDWLNVDAQNRHSYYAKRGGNLLEDDVEHALNVNAKGTAFEGKVKKISGQKFPDIVAARYYGIEVKSTISDHWTTTGSSILESTRLSDVERIYMTFGKLGGTNIEFISRPYEECLYDIAVTHMPRYRIDMKLPIGKTIFDKMGISYDELRQRTDPVKPVADYYTQLLRPGERLWWAGSAENTTGAAIRLFRNIPIHDKNVYKTYACVNFPEIFSGNYDRYVTWLASRSIVDPSVRDQFSAGGQEPMTLSNGNVVKFPGVFRRVKENLDYFYDIINRIDTTDLTCNERVSNIERDARIEKWCGIVADKNTKMSREITFDALCTLFFGRKDF